jgi:hypothetical protein
MAAIILAALLALVLSIASANAGTCVIYNDGTDTVRGWQLHRHGSARPPAGLWHAECGV